MMSPGGKCLLLLICGCHMASPVVADCPYQECPCYLTSISCGLRGLTSMPVLYSANATGYLSLNLNSNHITEIPAESLPVGLRELSLLNNPITTINDNAFNEVSATLQTLYFLNPQLSEIPDAFLKLDSLKILYIINSTVLDWNAPAMVHIGETLEVLKLEKVGFTAWPDWLAQFEHLNDLDLADNAISSIPDNAFDTFYNLMTLTLSGNNFTAVPKAMAKLTNLTTLNLENNNISNITWLPQSSKLTSLSLDSNRISDAEHLSNVLRTYADSLHSLALPFNQLKAIPDLSFVADFWFCDLSNNKISDPNSGLLNNSTSTIDLSYNLLPSIPKIYSDLTAVFMMFLSNNVIQVVQGINIPTWVTHLELQNNLITELNDTSFPENSTLENLMLDNNPLEIISELAFKNLGSLTKLSLQNTRLTRLPLSLVYLTSISYIVLNNNTGLVCTCAEKAVEEVADYIDLNGNCGDISIYDFLADLSGSCR